VVDLLFEPHIVREPSDLYDWFKGWVDLKPVLADQISSADRVLMLGCGNSSTLVLSLRFCYLPTRHLITSLPQS
jgi:hypothetical protein